MKLWLPRFWVGMLLIPTLFLTGARSVDDQAMVQAVRQVYGDKAAARTVAWRELIAQGQRENWSEQRKLTEVNRFFNRLRFIDDYLLWGMKDYWAVPLEFLGAAAGDCEDYSIAKYFSLLELGVLYLAVGGLAYGLESVWQWLRGRHYYWDNRFEVEAYRLGRERFNRPAKRLE